MGKEQTQRMTCGGGGLAGHMVPPVNNSMAEIEKDNDGRRQFFYVFPLRRSPTVHRYILFQTIATILYIYLATVTKAITFGGFLGDITGGLQVPYSTHIQIK